MYLLGVDVGTRAAHAVVIDEAGQIVVGGIAPNAPFLSPAPGWAEQDPREWWRAFCGAIGKVLSRGVSSNQIKGIALSGQAGMALLDEDGEVLRPAIIAHDRRAEQQGRWLSEKLGDDRLIALTCNRIAIGLSLPQMLWIRENEPELWRRARYTLPPKDYVRYRLTGDFATDVSDASGTLLFDVIARRWSRAMMAVAGIDERSLPDIYESAQQTGEVTHAAAVECGLREGTPVIAGASDRAATAVAMGLVSSGDFGVTLTARSGHIIGITERPAVDSRGRVRTGCHAAPGKWHVARMVRGDFSHSWFVNRTLVNAEDSLDLLCEEAQYAAPPAEHLFWLPNMLDEGAPMECGLNRAALVGLTGRHTRAHVARAILEGIAFSLRDNLGTIPAINFPISSVRLGGNGARSTLWRQVQSDVCRKTVHSIEPVEGPAFGAALLAGVGCGAWPSIETACSAAVRTTGVSEPDLANADLLDERYATYRSLSPALTDLITGLHQ